MTTRPYCNRPTDRYRPLSAADVKARVDVHTFYESELNRTLPARTGWVAGGLCPFHDDHHAGSFRVNLATGGFYCHACQAGGKSIIDFLMLRDGLPFTDALRTLHRQWLGGGDG